MVAAFGPLAIGQKEASPEGGELFEKHIKPIFVSRCQGCHNDSLKFSGLTLDSGEGLRRGGLHGPVVANGDPAGSR